MTILAVPTSCRRFFMMIRTLGGPVRSGLFVLLASTVLLLSSCSGSGALYPVRGKVLVKDAPAKGAVVTFHPKGQDSSVTAQRPSGVADENGSFTLMTGSKNGAPAGEYMVTIVWDEEVQTKKIVLNPDSLPAPKDRLGGRYATLVNSKISAQVKSGNNELEPFRLD
jgi:hypothetical protein